ncbi:TRAP-type C4-dicarboxylate transport system permease small subunit [Anaerosolibacter carboniphilus]|uniref:TRAP-type C4-dicarboxylate transport system permease small subunit n=1 Tax=Anaerosolibacter carboniphilus TaxID=1417629 RepID=A0A841KL16_9FIRM|nr:TRAP transporter small permease [Anaerosolibacter carboniphilus]MBB6214137.1 TRAP-type C4-dicarboxylate transport system permease small subunit [Anaerosolibacter carboniphilus]
MNKLFNKTLSKFEEIILSYSVILMAVVLIGSVISRSLFNRSWTFAEEVGQSLVIIVTFMGIGYAAKKAKHISMSAIFDLVKDKYKKMFIYVISSVTSISMFYLTYLGFQYVQKVQQLGRVTPALRIPMYLIITVVPIGFLLGGIEYARTFIINIKEKEIYLSSEKILGQDHEEISFSEPDDIEHSHENETGKGV